MLGLRRSVSGDMEAARALLALLLSWILMVESQNLIKNSKEQKLEGQLLISEVNSDNPGHDTAEFLELYHTSGQNVSLDNYTLVFYNGKTNMAYKVLNLSGRSTDKRGFFLIGSIGVSPKPAIILPTNTIQNGPDAIALYFGKGPYKENMRVTREGLVDALVHKAKSTDQADVLQKVLTPGAEAFLEDASFHTSDESIGRCLELDGQWNFKMTHISPWNPNFCKGFPEIMINEVPSPFAQDLYIEIKGPPSTLLSGLVLAFISGESNEIYYSTDIRGLTGRNGLYLLEGEKHDNRAQQTLPDTVRLMAKGGGAVALYLGKSSRILPKTPFPTNGLIDALVYTDYEGTVSQPLQELTAGRPIIYWQHGNNSTAASRCTGPEGKLTAFLLTNSTPGQANDCRPESVPDDVHLCFRITDCTVWEGENVISEFQAALVQSLQSLCQCNVSSSSFIDARLTCDSTLLTLHMQLNASLTLQKADFQELQQHFVSSGDTVIVGGRNATVLPSCLPLIASSTLPSATDPTTEGPPTSEAPALLINEVNPNTPGAAEDMEYIELYHPGGSSFSLDGYWLVLYNGKNNLAYLALDLKGNHTNTHGYFLVGSNKLKPLPHISLPFNTIQNGADAVALYYRPAKGYKKNMEVTAEGLVDAIVYVSDVGDDAKRLLKVLAPGQEAVHEDERFLLQDESLSRCHGLILKDQSSFQVTKITPLADNDCPKAVPSSLPSVTPTMSESSPPVPSIQPMSIVINEVGLSHGRELYNFIELKGPPGGKLHELIIVLYDVDGKVYDRFMLQGMLGLSGIYVIGTNSTSSDQLLQLLSRPNPHVTQALALYRGTLESFPLGSSITQKGLLDAVVHSWEDGADAETLRDLSKDRITLHVEQRFLSVSRCLYGKGSHRSMLLPVPHPSPGTENLCPTSIASLQLDFCMKDSSLNCSELEPAEQKTMNSLKTTLSLSMKNHCKTGFTPPSYIQDLQLTCAQNQLSISGNILTYHNDQQCIESWNADLLTHPEPFKLQERSLEPLTACLVPEKVQGTFRTWHISLLIVLFLLLLFGAVGLILFLRKRRPQNYTSIEMNPHLELTYEY
ncbi:hypothetical protein XENTR_v10023963 [Xenopus tropicalis]|uniref:Uncharacterized protein LOC780342 isoform X1 n=1 Tax=Xenopus tropicalis TaxID=8364 RepID=A0A8J0SVS9_XENTR|nr:uncharacterized protein LOC780342 isoform X1 [Xenopus tropicalis]KAE8579246.1 hypothetical protein XENTR_v10023963 [Xenopus tropicalis]KAE8579247.1 hypothetical protein XENTR_v10023963 [Xenopus tropicalis]